MNDPFTLVWSVRSPLFTAKNTLISPNFLVRKFCGKAQFPHSFGRFARNYAETEFPQNFHSWKSGEIAVFFAVIVAFFSQFLLI